MVSFLLVPMAVTPEFINWLGIVFGLGNKLPRKVIQWPIHFAGKIPM